MNWTRGFFITRRSGSMFPALTTGALDQHDVFLTYAPLKLLVDITTNVIVPHLRRSSNEVCMAGELNRTCRIWRVKPNTNLSRTFRNDPFEVIIEILDLTFPLILRNRYDRWV